MIWSRNLAYVVGLIATDGSLSKDGRHIDFTTKDLELAKTYKLCLQSNAKIGTKTNGQRTSQQYRVQIGSVKLYRFLMSIGLHPNKTHTLSAISIPEKYYADFLRGCFDGDGSIWGYWDKRWGNSFMYYLTFTGASKDFISWLQQRNNVLYGVEGHISINGGKFYQLRYAKRESAMVFRVMNYKDSLPRLERKHQKVIQIFTSDPYFDRIAKLSASGEIGIHATLRG